MSKMVRAASRCVDGRVADLVAGLRLSDLYRLAGATAKTLDSVSSVAFRFRGKPLDLGAIKEAFTPLRTALPQIDTLIDMDAITNAAVAEHEEDHTFGWSLTDIAPEAPQIVTALNKAARHRIETEDWDKLSKAEGFLADYICWNGTEAYIDAEALVYLRSRGRECQDEIERTAIDWRLAAEAAVRDFAKGCRVEDCGDPEKSRRRGQMTMEEAGDIMRWSSFTLRNFWGARHEDDEASDATMLRTVGWCDIGGFDIWWKRRARETVENIAQLGIANKVAAAHWLSAMCRSDLALRMIREGLETGLWALTLGQYGDQCPWRVPDVVTRDGRRFFDSVAIACAIGFASCRLGETRLDRTVVSEALDFILQAQSVSGGWPGRAHDAELWSEHTAMAVHALALAKPPSWERAADAAAKWLWSHQDPFGHRYIEGGPSPVCLTVLVLDAIELAGGGAQVTFRLPTEEAPAVRAPVTPRAPAGHQWTQLEMNILEALHYAA